jgi:hypothetical protein
MHADANIGTYRELIASRARIVERPTRPGAIWNAICTTESSNGWSPWDSRSGRLRNRCRRNWTA